MTLAFMLPEIETMDHTGRDAATRLKQLIKCHARLGRVAFR